MKYTNKIIYSDHNFINSSLDTYEDCTFININFSQKIKPIYFLSCEFNCCTFNKSWLYIFDYCRFNSCNFSGTFKATLVNCSFGDKVHVPYVPLVCPVEGEFVGWKVCHGQNNRTPYLVKLRIPEGAGRTSSFSSRKCRCERALVLDIQHIDGTPAKETTVVAYYSGNLKYTKGQWVCPDYYDDNRQMICAHGIHFFMERQEAINFYESEWV